MSEELLNWVEFSKIIWLSVFALLYSRGGMKGKWQRRYLATAFLTGGFMMYSYIASELSYWFLLAFPLYALALSSGYGVDSKWMKLTKSKFATRFLYGLVVSLCCLPVVIVTNHWVLFGLHILLCTLMFGILGSQNPVKARSEETMLGFISGFLPIYMV